MYITCWNPPKSRQITFDEILEGVVDVNSLMNYGDKTSTMTVCRNDLSQRLQSITNIKEMISKLKSYNEKYAELEASNLASHYRHFTIPKKSGGERPIDAPDQELKDALTELRLLLKSFMIADYHTAAHAYVENRGTLSAVKAHQMGHVRYKTDMTTGDRRKGTYLNNWGVSFDFHGFFPSTSFRFLMGQLSQIYPFALIMQDEEGKAELQKAIRMCFLNGGLPQGTPISPWLTNVMMIPFDHLINRKLTTGFKMKDGITRQFTYTRYADDIDISCHLSFDPMEMQDVIKAALEFIHAPFTLNEEKTHYGNRNSSENWMLGLMWNKDNEITVGWRNLKQFKAQIVYYIDAKKNGNGWELEDVQKFNGKISYYRMVEAEKIDYIIDHYNQKFDVNLMAMIKDDLRPKEGIVS